MERPSVYVETTIASYYHTSRTSPHMIAEREITRAWWAHARVRCELLTGVVVLDELEAGPGPETVLRLKLLAGLPVLGRTPEVDETVEYLIGHRAMPAFPSLDAVHLALAMHHGCEVLVTWDRKHLANPNKAAHLMRIAEPLGLRVPLVVTPREHLETFR
ncbi:MAG TPA: PIN domain-containing protein [Longimicrobium sp.]|nr:PIN domain-containing protein [Longimicrobium sp.]